ncbi:hypothetical protein HK097_004222, partial [Rhizophlyctis rosea]
MARIGSFFKYTSGTGSGSSTPKAVDTPKLDAEAVKDALEDVGSQEGDSDTDFDAAPETPAALDNSSSAPLPHVDISKSNLKSLAPVAAENLTKDLEHVQIGLTHFLNSQFNTADALLRPHYGLSLYHSLGVAVIRSIKAAMTFEPADIQQASDALNVTVEMASAWRKKEAGMVASVVGLVWSSGSSDKSKRPDPTGFRSMNNLQRHAELVYAEAYLMKAMISLLTDTNMVAFVREGMNIRSAYNIYKNCYKFLETELEEVGPDGLRSIGVDEHFVSGALMGIGAFNMALGMVPSRVLRVFEMIGFGGDRTFGLSRLQLGGGWSPTEGLEEIQPATSKKKKPRSNSGSIRSGLDPLWTALLVTGTSTTSQPAIRTPLCNLVLLMYHIILSSQIQLPDCNLPFGQKILASELRHHPDSFIFITLHARSLQTQRDPDSAIIQYKRVMEMQKEWKQLAHVCLWDMGLCWLALGRFKEAAECYEVLRKESRWSRAMYAYMLGVCLYAEDAEGNAERVSQLFEEVPRLRRKVAGRSIPIEKFIARKCRKYSLQKSRLLLPHLEMLYIFNGLDIIPPTSIPSHLTLMNEHLSSLELQLQQARKNNPGQDELTILPYETYNDDICLAHFLKSILLREVHLPKSETLLPARTLLAKQKAQRETKEWKDVTKPNLLISQQHLKIAISRGPDISLDHWILPFCRVEMGQTLMRMGDFEGAKREFEFAVKGG